MTFRPVDWCIVCGYFAVVLFVGLYLVKKPKTVEGYFLANRRLKWPFIGASMLASNISAEHFVGLAGGGYVLGMAVGGAYEWSAVFCIMPLVVIFLPLYMRNRIYTVPEFLERRFSPGVRLLLSGLMLVFAVLTKISISLWASAKVFNVLFGWNPLAIITVVGIITALYTMKGGLGAVIYTDAIQTTVLLFAAATLTVLGLHEVGGWEALKSRVPEEMLHVIKPPTHPDVPWTGIVLTVVVAGSFYWSMDQVLVQRVFAAENLNEGRKGALFAAFLKLLPPFVLVLPGIIAKALYPGLAHADDAYPTLLQRLMPVGLLGLTVAGISAALMGHLSATYNSVATLFTRDFYAKLRPGASQERQVWVGRLTVLVVTVLGIIWAPIIGNFQSLWDYLQSISIYLIMPFVGVFYMGVLSARITSQGVFASVLTGFVVGPLIMFDYMQAGKDWQAHFLPFLRYPLMTSWLHGAFLELLICLAVLWVVSLLTPRPRLEAIATTLMRSGPISAVAGQPRARFFRDYRFWMALVLTMTASLYVIWR